MPHLVAIAKICEPEVQLLASLEPFGVTARMRMIDPVDWQIRKAKSENYLSGIAERLQNARSAAYLHILLMVNPLNKLLKLLTLGMQT